MAGNMLDYIAWRGDSGFGAVPFNEVDALIFSTLAYVRWEDMLIKGASVRLNALTGEANADVIKMKENTVRLLRACIASKRFGKCVIRRFADEFDEEICKQFAAVTFALDDGTIFVAYRGTDETIVGWKEDMNLAFTRPVPSQLRAAEYLRDSAANEGGLIRLGGHSKGGNLAVFAAVMADDRTRMRITDIYSMDAPGQNEDIYTSEAYASIERRLRSFVPQSSIVGMLLAHPDSYRVVKSASFSVLQHDPFNWQVMGPAFVGADGLEKDSLRFEKIMRGWLARTDEKTRRSFVDTVFELLSASESRTLGREWLVNTISRPQAFIQALKDVDPEARGSVAEMLGALVMTVLGRQERIPGEGSNDGTET